MKHLQKIFLVLITASLFNACNTTEPPSNQTLTLKLEDVSCTEAWIQLTTNNLQLPTTINILKNNTVAQTFSLSKSDTLLYIDSLLPNQTYKILATMQPPVPMGYNNASNEISVTTMDTTSHNFTWQTFTFGDAGAGSSTLYDVTIIDENNIWAVGEIYMLDSLGRPDPNAYNAVHWDGTKWELKRIGGVGGWPCHTVFAFSTNNVWFEGNIHWDGSRYSVHMNGWPLLPNGDGWRVNKMWGTSSSDLYAVGNNGNIAHWDGGKWTKIESGTTLPINDIWGINYNEDTKVFAVASNIYQFEDKKILSISSSGVSGISNTGLPMDLGSTWCSIIYKTYVGGDGLYVKYYNKNYWSRIILPTYFIFSIRGNGLNDLTVCGGLGYVGHFNGSTWINYLGNGINEIQGNYYASAIKGNKFAAVGGEVGGKAVAIIGTR